MTPTLNRPQILAGKFTLLAINLQSYFIYSSEGDLLGIVNHHTKSIYWKIGREDDFTVFDSLSDQLAGLYSYNGYLMQYSDLQQTHITDFRINSKFDFLNY